MNRAEKRRQLKLNKKDSKKTLGTAHEKISNLFSEAVKHHKSGNLKEAEVFYQKILSINPDLPEVHYGLGIIHNVLDDNFNAEKSYRHAIALKPDYADAHANLGNALSSMGRLEEAVSCYESAIKFNPKGANLYNNLGITLQKLCRHSDAISYFTKAVKLIPDFFEAHCNLGISLKETCIFDEALKSLERGISIQPNSSGAYNIKGDILKDLGRFNQASQCYRQALVIQPDFAEAKCNLGGVLMSIGRLDEALSCFRELGSLAANNYLHAILYKQGISNDELFNECLKINSNREKINKFEHPTMLGLKKRGLIRIGYVSSDFREHPVGLNIISLIKNHNHHQFEIFCYAELSIPDKASDQFQKHADHWRTINDQNDREVAEMMRADGIQIAVFLGGNFDDNRPGIASYKPAPVQVAMHGGTTTGLNTMDYWLSDNILHPKAEADESEKFTESIWRLPNFYNFTIPTKAPDVSPLPAHTNGYVTFVSFNKPCKINNDVLDLWSDVLKATPGSKLILKFRNYLNDVAIADPILKRFTANGIANDRINLITSLDDFNEHLSHYHLGDIALDTFPFSGATTTFQALWMGLPVVSLHGKRFISRMGESISKHVGLDGHCASTSEDYIKICASLANDLEQLSNLRKRLRNQVTNSALCDGLAYTRNFEDAIQTMWERKKERKNHKDRD